MEYLVYGNNDKLVQEENKKFADAKAATARMRSLLRQIHDDIKIANKYF